MGLEKPDAGTHWDELSRPTAQHMTIRSSRKVHSFGIPLGEKIPILPIRKVNRKVTTRSISIIVEAKLFFYKVSCCLKSYVSFIDEDVNSRCVLIHVSKSKNIPLQQKRNSNKTQNRNWRRQLLSLKLLYSVHQFSSHALFCYKKGNFFLKTRISIYFLLF